jgi:hypothetical protein
MACDVMSTARANSSVVGMARRSYRAWCAARRDAHACQPTRGQIGGRTWVRPGSDRRQTWVRPAPDLGQTGARPGPDRRQTGVRPGPDRCQTWARPGSDLGQTPARPASDLGLTRVRDAPPRDRVGCGLASGHAPSGNRGPATGRRPFCGPEPVLRGPESVSPWPGSVLRRATGWP